MFILSGSYDDLKNKLSDELKKKSVTNDFSVPLGKMYFSS